MKYNAPQELRNARSNRVREHRQRLKKFHKKQRGMNPQYRRRG